MGIKKKTGKQNTHTKKKQWCKKTNKTKSTTQNNKTKNKD
jgi:hypothetical protein